MREKSYDPSSRQIEELTICSCSFSIFNVLFFRTNINVLCAFRVKTIFILYNADYTDLVLILLLKLRNS
ncbi:hypothetical protein CAJAP_10701 [Camponotus japonicus]